MKNFWESRTLFIKRVLAAGGKSGGGFGSQNKVDRKKKIFYNNVKVKHNGNYKRI
jgi:hypothetical protein